MLPLLLQNQSHRQVLPLLVAMRAHKEAMRLFGARDAAVGLAPVMPFALKRRCSKFSSTFLNRRGVHYCRCISPH